MEPRTQKPEDLEGNPSSSIQATAVPTEPVAVSKVTGDSAVDSLGKKAKAAQDGDV